MNPHPHGPFEADDPSIRAVAARWVVRRDRGLSPSETGEFERWLSADPRHRTAVARSTAAWDMLGRMPARVACPFVDERVPSPAWRWRASGTLAAAAIVVLLMYLAGSREPGRVRPDIVGPANTGIATTVAPRTQTLPDGTLVRLNRDAELGELFTTAERRVRLVRGEAHFAVTSDPARPFVVQAHKVEVRAIGTAFNVHLQPQSVDVLVTEGEVRVTPPVERMKPARTVPAPVAGDAVEDLLAAPVVVAGQRAVVALNPPASGPRVIVSEAEPAELARAQAWREPLLRLGGATLAELAVEFERHTGRRLVLTDEALGNLRIGGRFRSHDVEGFVRVLEENYGIKSARAPDGTFLLSR